MRCDKDLSLFALTTCVCLAFVFFSFKNKCIVKLQAKVCQYLI